MPGTGGDWRAARGPEVGAGGGYGAAQCESAAARATRPARVRTRHARAAPRTNGLAHRHRAQRLLAILGVDLRGGSAAPAVARWLARAGDAAGEAGASPGRTSFSSACLDGINDTTLSRSEEFARGEVDSLRAAARYIMVARLVAGRWFHVSFSPLCRSWSRRRRRHRVLT